jgi:hypothetical protein
MIMDIQEKWDRFLIDCWITDRGRNLRIMIVSFQSDNNVSEIRYDNPLELKKYPIHLDLTHLDVFGFIARYFPKVSSWLLAHVKNHKIDADTKEKIIQAFLKMKMPGKYGGIGRQLDAKKEFRKDIKQVQANALGYKISKQRIRAKHAWHITK